jgi:hypothetical protein
MPATRGNAPAYFQLAPRGKTPWARRYCGVYRPADVAAMLDQPMDLLALNAAHKILFRVAVS